MKAFWEFSSLFSVAGCYSLSYYKNSFPPSASRNKTIRNETLYSFKIFHASIRTLLLLFCQVLSPRLDWGWDYRTPSHPNEKEESNQITQMFPHQIQMFGKCGQQFWIMSDSPYGQVFHHTALIQNVIVVAWLCANLKSGRFCQVHPLCEEDPPPFISVTKVEVKTLALMETPLSSLSPWRIVGQEVGIYPSLSGSRCRFQGEKESGTWIYPGSSTVVKISKYLLSNALFCTISPKCPLR